MTHTLSSCAWFDFRKVIYDHKNQAPQSQLDSPDSTKMSAPLPSKVSMNCTLVQLREEATFRRHDLGNVPLTKKQLVDLLGDGSMSSKAAAQRSAIMKKATPTLKAKKTTATIKAGNGQGSMSSKAAAQRSTPRTPIFHAKKRPIATKMARKTMRVQQVIIPQNPTSWPPT